jgi:hypothetical protein
MLKRTTFYTAGAALLLSLSLQAQQSETAAPAAAPAAGPLSSSLGVFVFPAKGQAPEQQSNDETACFGWAKTQTGIDPLAIKPQAAAAAQSPGSASNAGSGSVAKGAVGGAVVGTAVGAIAGDTGKGAAIGATMGAFSGVGAKRKAQQQAAAQQQQAAAQQQQAAQASVAEQKATYNRAFAACLEGKGYTVK